MNKKIFERVVKYECPCCEGSGELHISNCCGVPSKSNGDGNTSDIGICPECREHCEYGIKCEECDGTGEINSTK